MGEPDFLVIAVLEVLNHPFLPVFFVKLPHLMGFSQRQNALFFHILPKLRGNRVVSSCFFRKLENFNCFHHIEGLFVWVEFYFASMVCWQDLLEVLRVVQ